MSSFELHVIINAYLSLSISLTFLFARHCLTIIKRVEALEEVRPAENRLACGRNRTRHKLSLGNCMGVWLWWGRYILKNDFYKQLLYHIICLTLLLGLRILGLEDITKDSQLSCSINAD